MSSSAIFGTALLYSLPGEAQDTPTGEVLLPSIVVSATRLPTPENETGTSATVITREEIERKQERTIVDALRDAPGLNVVQTGGPGGVASVFIRGTNSNHVKVIIDGIYANDPSAPTGAFDFSNLLTSDIERIEILRGPQSGLYGSDALGGVVNIVTRRGEGPLKVGATLEGGSFGTFNQTGNASGSVDRLSYAFDVGHFRSAETPVTPLDQLPPGRSRIDDFYDNKTLSTRLGYNVTDNFDLGLVARYVDSDLLFTGQDFSRFPSVPAAAQSESQNRQLFTRATGHLVLLDGRFDQVFGIGYTDYRRRDIGAVGAPSFNRGDRVKFDWQGTVKLVEGETLILGAESQKDAIRDSPISAEVTNNAGFIELQSNIGDRFFNSASVRYDSNERFGSKPTFKVAPSYKIIETGTVLKGSVGSGFKAPSLNQLFVSFPAFNFFANPNLRPETSLAYDLGFEQSGLGLPIRGGATYFHDDIDNLINTGPTTIGGRAATTYVNIQRASTYGAEAFIAYKPIEAIDLRLDYTYTIANDDVLHQELLRRPKHKASLNAAWQATDKLLLSATLLYVGSDIDLSRNGAISRLKTTPYTTVNLAGTYTFNERYAAFARINNLFDRHYQVPSGYLQPSLGVFGGFKVNF